MNERTGAVRERSEERSTEKNCNQLSSFLIFVRGTAQPRNYEIGEQSCDHEQEKPSCGSHFPSIAFHLFLRMYSQQSSLSFVKDQFQTSGTVNPCMANYEKKVLLFEDLRLFFRHLVSAARAGQVPCFPLAERARRVCTAGYIEIVQAILSLLCEAIICSHPFQQTLPP